jgi:UDP-glucuronate decarboxylase
MRYLVTGGAGFVGSHLCDQLVSARHDVVCVDFTLGQSAILSNTSLILTLN